MNFCRDILKDVQTSKYSPSKDNDSTIKIRKRMRKLDISIIIKIYKNINQRGNITLLNNVVSFKIIKTNNNILKIKIKQGDTNYYKEKTSIYSQKAFISLYLVVIFSFYLSIISFILLNMV